MHKGPTVRFVGSSLILRVMLSERASDGHSSGSLNNWVWGYTGDSSLRKRKCMIKSSYYVSLFRPCVWWYFQHFSPTWSSGKPVNLLKCVDGWGRGSSWGQTGPWQTPGILHRFAIVDSILWHRNDTSYHKGQSFHFLLSHHFYLTKKGQVAIKYSNNCTNSFFRV